MSVFDRIGQLASRWIGAPEQRASPENPSFSLSDPSILSALNIGGGSLSAVSPVRAMGIANVYTAVRVRSESFATVPAHVFRRTDQRNTEKIYDTGLAQILSCEANGYQTSYQFFESGNAQIDLWGGFHAEIQRNNTTGEVIALYPLNAADVEPFLERRSDGVYKRYRVNGIIVDDHDIFYVPGLGWDGVSGRSAIAMQRSTMNAAMAIEEFSASFYKNGTRLSGSLDHPGTLSEAAGARLRESFTQIYAGSANAGKVAILEEGMKFNPFTMPLVDAEYVATRDLQLKEIAGIFRVPPHMMGERAGSNYATTEQAGLEFVIYTMMSVARKWEQEFKRKCFTSTQQKDHYVKFNFDALLRGDTQSRFTAYATARQWGWMSVNDIREKEDLNSIADGDTYLVPLNMTPANMLGKADPNLAKRSDDAMEIMTRSAESRSDKTDERITRLADTIGALSNRETPSITVEAPQIGVNVVRMRKKEVNVVERDERGFIKKTVETEID